MSRTLTLPPVAVSIRAQVVRDGSIFPDAQRETVEWLTPKARARASAAPRDPLRYSARVMRQMCVDRTFSVKAFCAVRAKAASRAACDHRHMQKKHPLRPHLHAWRLKMGKTQEWLADQIGCAHSTVLRWEKGAAGVDDATFSAIAKAYGITVAELSARPCQSGKARELDRLMRAVREMDEEGLRALATMAERLTPAQ
jgi:transcriptional regulator with XRE-family HTH domain